MYSYSSLSSQFTDIITFIMGFSFRSVFRLQHLTFNIQQLNERGQGTFNGKMMCLCYLVVNSVLLRVTMSLRGRNRTGLNSNRIYIREVEESRAAGRCVTPEEQKR
uniref:Uncharacterized protein n=1 Tax=Megaselia scalaris TaxID=36166 RepID=T1GVY9_MEGSC